jgi:hypothetical protein
VAEVTPEQIMVSVPTRGTVAFQTVAQLNKIRDEYPGLAPIHYECDSLSVVRTRNKIVEAFMATDKRVLVMVDDDVVPILQLLSLADAFNGGEFGMVGVPYPTYDPRVGFHMAAYTRVIDGIQPIQEFPDPMNEVDVLATGCVLIARDALTTINRYDGPWFRFDHDDPVSEDVIFCDDLRERGWKIGCWIGDGFSDHIRTMPLGMPYLDQCRQYSTRV